MPQERIIDVTQESHLTLIDKSGKRRIPVPPLPMETVYELWRNQEAMVRAFSKMRTQATKTDDDEEGGWSWAGEFQSVYERQKNIVVSAIPDFPPEYLSFRVMTQLSQVVLEEAGLGGTDEEGKEAPPNRAQRRARKNNPKEK